MAEPLSYTIQMSPEYFEKHFGYIFKTKDANINESYYSGNNSE